MLRLTLRLKICKIYKSNIFCSQCKNGFVVSLDEKSCEKFTTVSNCSKLSRFECNSCSKNFILNKNFYFKTSFSTNTSIEKMNVLQKILNYKNKSQSFENAVQCERVSIENCSELEDFNKCKVYSQNYFLKEEKTCEQYPKKK